MSLANCVVPFRVRVRVRVRVVVKWVSLANCVDHTRITHGLHTDYTRDELGQLCGTIRPSDSDSGPAVHRTLCDGTSETRHASDICDGLGLYVMPVRYM